MVTLLWHIVDRELSLCRCVGHLQSEQASITPHLSKDLDIKSPTSNVIVNTHSHIVIIRLLCSSSLLLVIFVDDYNIICICIKRWSALIAIVVLKRGLHALLFHP